jgi:enediyne biosynthesis protein E5
MTRTEPLRRLGSRLARDPRHYQILVLGSLLAYGVLALDLEVRAAQALVIVAAAFATQLAGSLAGWLGASRRPDRHRSRQPPSQPLSLLPPSPSRPAFRFDPKSAAISALSLCLLLRTGRPALAAAAAVLAIGSKFVIRVRGKHLFNPTNFGLVAMMVASRGQVWVSPGQWGSAALFAFLVLCLGGLVVNRAARADVTWAFLAAYGSLLAGRATWLGQPPASPLHQMASGAFLIFTFFMISDPKTTPDSRPARILFAVLVALVAGWFQFALYRPTALLLALACVAPLVPLLDRLLPGETYRWPRPAPMILERRLV